MPEIAYIRHDISHEIREVILFGWLWNYYLCIRRNLAYHPGEGLQVDAAKRRPFERRRAKIGPGIVPAEDAVPMDWNSYFWLDSIQQFSVITFVMVRLCKKDIRWQIHRWINPRIRQKPDASR